MGKMKSWVVTWQKLSQRYKAQEDFSGQGIPAVVVVQMDHQGRRGDWGWGKKVIKGADHPQGRAPHELWKTLLAPQERAITWTSAQGETQQHSG